MKNKPKFINKKSVYINGKISYGKNVTIYPNNVLIGNITLEDNVTLFPFNYIKDSSIGKGTSVSSSHIEDSHVESNCTIGPFSRLRPKSNIGNGCKIGNFVEVKNSIIKDYTKASHLAYIGDAEVGRNCNIGCGAIFVNYNGKTKSKTIVGDNCFIGSNANLIAPLNISDKTYITAGTTLTKNTDAYDFVIGRTRETIKPNYSSKYFKEEK